MNKVAFARLLRDIPGHARQCVVELIELDLPTTLTARFVVTVRQGELRNGLLMDAAESSLTAAPTSRVEAERRALDFVHRRLAAGEQLVQQEGFATLQAAAPSEPAPRDDKTPPTPADAHVPPAIAALARRFHPDAWKLEPPIRRSRAAWRVGECSDTARPESPGQKALVALVPRLVSLLETGDDMLDLSLAVAMGRLGDPGAAPALQQLAERGRSPATRRAAHQAWLMLQTPEARQAHADTLLPGWPAESLSRTDPVDDLVPALERLLEGHTAVTWARLLTDWHDIALARPEAHAGLLALLRVIPIKPGFFQAVRQVYKAAEARRDIAVLAVLHSRFEDTPALFRGAAASHAVGFTDPTTRRWTAVPLHEELRRPSPRMAYGSRTRDHLRLRGWRQLRRLAALRHSQAPELAVQLLLQVNDLTLPPAHREWSYSTRTGQSQWRHYAPGAHWVLLRHLLLAHHPEVHASGPSSRWYTLQPLDAGLGFAERPEALRPMWDAHPEALLKLALLSRCAMVQAMAARALQDHLPFLQSQSPADLARLLQSPHAPTASVAFDAVKARLLASGDAASQKLWLGLLIRAADAAARQFAFLHIASAPSQWARHTDVVATLLVSPHPEAHRQGVGLVPLADAPALVVELQGALMALDAEAAAAATDSLAKLGQLLQGKTAGDTENGLATAARQAAVEPLLCLLAHPAAAVLNLAVTWLLLHPLGLTQLAPKLLTDLLAENDLARRAEGVRLLAALPDAVLRTRLDLLGDLALHPHAALREAVAPAWRRLSSADPALALAIAERFHAALFASEPADGVHAGLLEWLTQELPTLLGGLAPPGRDTASLWRALQARSTGAQRYGAWGLAALPASAYSLRQQAVLAGHPDATVRAWALRALDATLGPQPSPEQAAELLPLADTRFDDSLAHAQALFAERLPDASLSVELLIAWIDHPTPWVQALGRARLVRRMDAAEASLCLTRLSQHPSPKVQLFVTQWLLELPRDDAAALAGRLRALKPYFLTVLSQVHRGRTAKDRVTAFLRELCGPPETATVVAEIFARQVVTASLTDKPQYIAGLRDIAARHPGIELPFVQWQRPAPRNLAGEPRP